MYNKTVEIIHTFLAKSDDKRMSLVEISTVDQLLKYSLNTKFKMAANNRSFLLVVTVLLIKPSPGTHMHLYTKLH